MAITAFTTPGIHEYFVPGGASSLTVLVVGGGGGGGKLGGGGAGGQVIQRTIKVSPGDRYFVLVGSGGVGSGSTSNKGGGGNPSAFGTLIAFGGGGGGSNASVNGRWGGGGGSASGGGGTGGLLDYKGGDGTNTSPFLCGGGAGANGPGADGIVSGNGGPGFYSSTFAAYGASGYFGGGGGGGSYSAGTFGAGQHGGGDGSSGTGSGGAANTGGGGGGGGFSSSGGNGGSGCVLVSASASGPIGWDSSTTGPGVEISTDGLTLTRPTSGGGSNYSGARALEGRSKGKRYYEIDIGTGSAGFADGIADVTGMIGSGDPVQVGYLNADSAGYIYYEYPNDGGTRNPGIAGGSGVYGILIDFDNMTADFYKDGVHQYTEVMNLPANTELFPAASIGTGSSATLKISEPFQYPPESTFMPWSRPDSDIAYKVAGTLNINGAPLERLIKAFSFDRLTFDIDGDPVTQSKPVGQTLSDPSDGSYEIILSDGFPGDVFVVAFDDYGIAFEPDAEVSFGDRIHPSTPNGYVYECDGAGTLPSTEPTWSNDTESSQAVGTASFIARPYYRPMVHGPVSPEPYIVGE